MNGSPRIGPPPVVSTATEPSLIARPSAWVIIAGLVALAAAEFGLPWASLRGQVILDGRTEPDGAATLVLGFAILVVALWRSAADTESRVVQVAPGLLGLIATGIAIDALQVAWIAVRDYPSADHAILELGMAAEVAGSLAVAVGGAATSLRVVRAATKRRSTEQVDARPGPGQRSNRNWVDPDMEPLVPNAPVLATVGATGAVVGGVIAVWLAGALGAGESSGVRFVGLGLAGVLLGPAVTVALWRRLTERRR